MPPSSAHAATHLKSLCSSNQVAPSWAHVAANIGLDQSPSQRAAESTHLVHTTQRATQPAPQRTHLRSRLPWHESSTKVTPTLWGQGPHNSLCARPAFTASQPNDQSHPLTCPWQSRLSYNRKARTTHTRDTPGAPSSGDQGDGVSDIRSFCQDWGGVAAVPHT